MLELALLTLVAAVATTFALDVLRPAWKLMMRRRPRTERDVEIDGQTVEAHPVH
jgi:hypothetical protein